MKIRIVSIGKTNVDYIQTGVTHFISRLKHYTKLEWIELNDVKNASKLDKATLQHKEHEILIPYLEDKGIIVLLDEHGKTRSSIQFAKFIEQHEIQSTPQLTFIIGGAFGFSGDMLALNYPKFALSEMTFTHQMIRLILIEQVYRAYTIIKHEKYHH